MELMRAPRSRGELAAWLAMFAGVRVGTRAVMEGHSSALDYLAHVFFQGRAGFGREGSGGAGEQKRFEDGAPERLDSVVWAARGTGKTFLGAAATMLDLVFKPGIKVRILGGSFEQSKRMHEHLRGLFEREELRELVAGRIGESRMTLTNGSEVELLAQSHTAVRGTRVQTLRCDEVELFKPDVFEAAMLTTRSNVFDIPGVGPTLVAGSVECLSTMHVPFGLMHPLVHDPARKVFKWGVLDVLERCERPCAGCGLWEECGGRVKSAKNHTGKEPDGGHMLVDDALRMKRRVSLAVWRTEMLCLAPSRADSVFPEFDAARHVFGAEEEEKVCDEGDGWGSVMCGIDFGFRAPTVILWANLDGDGVLRIVDERHVTGATTKQHAEAMVKGNGGIWRMPEWVGADPAGLQRQTQTGVSDVEVLQKAGLRVRSRGSAIDEGLRLIRARLAPGEGPVRLRVHERCVRLIEALTTYHYPSDPRVLTPVKDGSDHAVDALRYLVLNLDAWSRGRVGRY